MEENEKRVERLLKIAFTLVAISFVGALLVVRGEFIGEEGILYALGGMMGLSSAMFAGMVCFYIVGFKAGIKSK